MFYSLIYNKLLLLIISHYFRSIPNYVYGTFVRVVERMKNYPYKHYSYFSRQDDVSPTLFKRIVGFFKRGMSLMYAK